MNLHPEITRFLDANPAVPLDHLSVAEQRQYMRLAADLNFLRFGTRGPAVHEVSDHEVLVDGGHIAARVYRPGPEPSLPAHLSLHGGGWWQGSIDDYVSDAICRQRCAEAHTVIVALEYRLAPEHRFPTALNDAHAALRWLADNAGSLGIDPGNLSVGGSSAGGNVAAALALQARDEGGPGLVFQLLEVPVLDLTGQSARPAITTDREQAMFAGVPLGIEHYLGDGGQALDPRASPLHATDLSGLPPALIFTAEFDPLHLEGERYAERLQAAGVKATAVRHPGAIHGSALLTRTWSPAAEWQRQAAVALRDAHWDGAPGDGDR
jgi:acetyl esterase